MEQTNQPQIDRVHPKLAVAISRKDTMCLTPVQSLEIHVCPMKWVKKKLRRRPLLEGAFSKHVRNAGFKDVSRWKTRDALEGSLPCLSVLIRLVVRNWSSDLTITTSWEMQAIALAKDVSMFDSEHLTSDCLGLNLKSSSISQSDWMKLRPSKAWIFLFRNTVTTQNHAAPDSSHV